MNVLFHIDESEKWEMVLKNVENMLVYYQDTDEELAIEIVANGIAVVELKEDPFRSELYKTMGGLFKQGVKILACRNALQGNQIAETELLSFVRVVSAGVVELAVKQTEGYAYIKP